MRRDIEPSSLRVLYRDFLDPAQSQCCYACNRTLSTGVAFFLLAHDKPQPFGPKCAQDYAASSLRSIPDHSKGIDFPEDQLVAEDDSSATTVKNAFGQSSRNAAQRVVKTEREQNIDNAVIYASLRCERLPSLGFRASGLIWQPLADFFEAYKHGNITDRVLGIVVSTMRSTTKKPNVKFLSSDNLRACYAYGWLIAKTFAECAPTKKMSGDDYKRLCVVRDALRRDMFLDENGCAEVLGFAKKYLPHPPTAIQLRFVAARPPFTPTPQDQLKL